MSETQLNSTQLNSTQLNSTQLNSTQSDNSLLESINKLKRNPVFQMSLASKELFHSNVIAWLLTYGGKTSPIKNLFKVDGTNEIIHVFREKLHFDLLVVYCLKDALSSKKVFNQFIEENIRFVVIENKLKSVPEKKQFAEYDKKIKENHGVFRLENSGRKKNIKLSEQNTKKILFAPKLTHKCFSAEGWFPVSYEEYLEKLKECFPKTAAEKDENSVVIQKYIEMLEIIVNEVLGKILKSDLENPKAIPNQKNVALLDEIRIGDLYTKLWYSASLKKINELIDSKNLCDYTKSDFTNSKGLFDWKKIICLKNGKLFAGVQVQHDSFRVSVEPFYPLQARDDKKFKFKEKNNDSRIFEEVKEWEENILRSLDKKQEFLEPPARNQDVLKKFGDFKYMYRKIKETVRLDDLAGLVKSALKSIEKNKNELEKMDFQFE